MQTTRSVIDVMEICCWVDIGWQIGCFDFFLMRTTRAAQNPDYFISIAASIVATFIIATSIVATSIVAVSIVAVSMVAITKVA